MEIPEAPEPVAAERKLVEVAPSEAPWEGFFRMDDEQLCAVKIADSFGGGAEWDFLMSGEP